MFYPVVLIIMLIVVAVSFVCVVRTAKRTAEEDSKARARVQNLEYSNK